MMQKLLTHRPVWFDGILLIRIFTAVMIFPYGLELFNPAKMLDLQNFLNDIHFPLHIPMSYVAKIAEFAGSILLALGLFTRLIVIPLMVNMIVVIVFMARGIFTDEGATLFFILFLTFFFTGPGRLSLDYLFFERRKDDASRH